MRNFLITILRLLGMRSRRRERVILPTCQMGGGVLPGIDLNNSAALLDVMEDSR
jgi:hypothetical protein